MREFVTGDSKPTLIPDTYDAVCRGYQEKVTQFGDAIEYKFEVEGIEVRALASLPKDNTITRGSKLFRWIQAMSGKEIPVGVAINIYDVVGKRCRVVVNNNESKGVLYNKIEDILPAGAGVSDSDLPY
jgi:hypothetical protein